MGREGRTITARDLAETAHGEAKRPPRDKTPAGKTKGRVGRFWAVLEGLRNFGKIFNKSYRKIKKKRNGGGGNGGEVKKE